MTIRLVDEVCIWNLGDTGVCVIMTNYSSPHRQLDSATQIVSNKDLNNKRHGKTYSNNKKQIMKQIAY